MYRPAVINGFGMIRTNRSGDFFSLPPYANYLLLKLSIAVNRFSPMPGINSRGLYYIYALILQRL
jgi:hypothetical protein